VSFGDTILAIPGEPDPRYENQDQYKRIAEALNFLLGIKAKEVNTAAEQLIQAESATAAPGEVATRVESAKGKDPIITLKDTEVLVTELTDFIITVMEERGHKITPAFIGAVRHLVASDLMVDNRDVRFDADTLASENSPIIRFIRTIVLDENLNLRAAPDAVTFEDRYTRWATAFRANGFITEEQLRAIKGQGDVSPSDKAFAADWIADLDTVVDESTPLRQMLEGSRQFVATRGGLHPDPDLADPGRLTAEAGQYIRSLDEDEIRQGNTVIPTFGPPEPSPVEDAAALARDRIQNSFALDKKGKLSNEKIANAVRAVLNTEEYGSIDTSTTGAFLSDARHMEEDYASTQMAVDALIRDAQAKHRALIQEGISNEDLPGAMAAFLLEQLEPTRYRRRVVPPPSGVVPMPFEPDPVGLGDLPFEPFDPVGPGASPFQQNIDRFKRQAAREDFEALSLEDKILRLSAWTKTIKDFSSEAVLRLKKLDSDGVLTTADIEREFKASGPEKTAAQLKLWADNPDAALDEVDRQLKVASADFPGGMVTIKDVLPATAAALRQYVASGGVITPKIANDVAIQGRIPAEMDKASTTSAIERTLQDIGIGQVGSGSAYQEYLRTTFIPQIQSALTQARDEAPTGERFDVGTFVGMITGAPGFVEPLPTPFTEAQQRVTEAKEALLASLGGEDEEEARSRLQQAEAGVEAFGPLGGIQGAFEQADAGRFQPIEGIDALSERGFQERLAQQQGEFPPDIPPEVRAAIPAAGLAPFPQLNARNVISKAELFNIQPSEELDVARFAQEASDEDTLFQRYILDRLESPEFQSDFFTYAGELRRAQAQAGFDKYVEPDYGPGRFPDKFVESTQVKERLSDAQWEQLEAQSRQRTPFGELPFGIKKGLVERASRPKPVTALDYAETQIGRFREEFETTPGFIELTQTREQAEAKVQKAEEATAERQRESEFQRSLTQRGRTVFVGSR
jgi:hypothetical protein